MVVHETPGVFVEETADPPTPGAPDRAVPAFIGYTEKGNARTPTRIDSLPSFEQIFGTAQPETALTVSVVATSADPAANRAADLAVEVLLNEDGRSRHILYYALQLFYANGGTAAYIVSAGGFTSTGPLLADLEACLEPLAAVAEPVLVVIPEASALSNADFKTLTDATLSRCAELDNGFAIIDAHDRANSFGSATTAVSAAAANFRDQCTGTSHLGFGAAYAPYLATTLGFAVDETAVAVSYTGDGALQPPGLTLAGLRDADDRAYRAVKAKIGELHPVLPPSAAIAGVYARVDAEIGVWKAPANVPVAAVTGPIIEFSPAEADRLNTDPRTGKSINTIRRFTGRGTLVWGARTLAGNDNEYRYVNVRRFILAVRASARRAAERFVFEPNEAATWARVRASLEGLLTDQWRAGALQGIKPDQGFFVSVGLGSTMTEQDVLEGRMIVEIGLAVVRPAEFVILRFAQTMAEG